MVYGLIAGGLVLLVVGGDFLVRGAVAVARRFGVSELLIGITLVGFGTSTAELVTSLQAAFNGSPGIAVGNVVGSNIANILLILGVAAVIAPLATPRQALWRDGNALLLATIALVALAAFGTISRTVGILLMVALAAYTLWTYRRERRSRDAAALMHEAEAADAPSGPTRLWLATTMAAAGLCLTIVGAWLLIEGAIGVAAALEIADTIVGLTVVAVGTSLPELVVSVTASIRRHGDVAFGNVLGSNIFNILGILGLTAVVVPLDVPRQILGFDIWVALAATLILIVFCWTGSRLNRIEGGVLLALYVAYVTVLGIMA